MSESDATDDARAEAVKRIKRKRQFQQQLVVFVLVNVFLWASGRHRRRVPVADLRHRGLGIGIAPGWMVYRGSTDHRAEIQREMGKDGPA